MERKYSTHIRVRKNGDDVEVDFKDRKELIHGLHRMVIADVMISMLQMSMMMTYIFLVHDILSAFLAVVVVAIGVVLTVITLKQTGLCIQSRIDLVYITGVIDGSNDVIDKVNQTLDESEEKKQTSEEKVSAKKSKEVKKNVGDKGRRAKSSPNK